MRAPGQSPGVLFCEAFLIAANESEKEPGRLNRKPTARKDRRAHFITQQKNACKDLDLTGNVSLFASFLVMCINTYQGTGMCVLESCSCCSFCFAVERGRRSSSGALRMGRPMN